MSKKSNKSDMRKLFVCMVLCLLSLGFVHAADYHIIPAPQHVTYREGNYSLPNDIRISCPPELLNEGHLLQTYLEELSYHANLQRGEYGNILLKLDSTGRDSKPEGYTLHITQHGITVTGTDPAGVFYGIQSLMQIIRNNPGSETIPCGVVVDNPIFKWRSFMLDEARHFKGKNVVKNMIDRMAELKMNVFHWHLTDHQGWRIEIKKYPKLTSVGAYRDSTSIGNWKSGKYDGKPHWGFYTQHDIREIVTYAAQRHITIVPEIDMPGHCSAAIAAYPMLGSKDTLITVPCRFGPQYNVCDVTRPEVITVLRNILKEVINLFPSKIIHIGGDEVRFNHWEESVPIQEYMKEHQIHSPVELQLNFSNAMSNWITNQGCTMMGWNDITGDILHAYHKKDSMSNTLTLSKNSLVQFWKGDPKLITKVIRKGYNIINSYHVFTYLDYTYKVIPLEKAYNFQPVPEGLTSEEQQRVLGIGCQMWGEWIPTVADMNRQAFPRIAAYAETGWTSAERKDYAHFQESLSYLIRYWKTKGIKPGIESNLK